MAYKNYITTQDITVDFISNIPENDYFNNGNPHLGLTLFRIYQECMTNILRYSKAHEVIIELTMEEDSIILRIEDDGIGFEVDKVDTKIHHGLLGMRERVHLLYGNIKIDSTPGKGIITTVVFAKKRNTK